MTNDWNHAVSQPAMQNRWAGEITPLSPESGRARPVASFPQQQNAPLMPSADILPIQAGDAAIDGTLHMGTGLPEEVVNSPATVSEAYLSSLKSLLNKNTGNYVVAAFLIGTQNLVSWEGILYDVGSDFLTIYQEGRDRYIVCDIYSLKFIEFYDTRNQRSRSQPSQGTAQ